VFKSISNAGQEQAFYF